ncbi:hypothetical protein JCM10908_004910 [Rhodotorula pacifica]|uniref:tetratricopeptide repeat protein n=1 Tax=Rhodotorula pacifica TaxID=1495444 RepID=UPI003176E024
MCLTPEPSSSASINIPSSVRQQQQHRLGSPALSVPNSPTPSPPQNEPLASSRSASRSRSRPRTTTTQQQSAPGTPRTTKRSQEDRLAFREAKSLYEAGLHASKSNLLAAVMHFRQAAAVFGEIEGQEKRTEKCLWQAGMCWAKEGLRAKKARQRTVACEAFEQAKTLFHFIGDMGKEAMALYQLGLVTRDLAFAADSIKAAAILFAEAGDEAREAMCYAELGHSFGVNDPDTGIYYLKQALLLYLKLADVAKEAHALFSIGTLAARLSPTTDPPSPTASPSARGLNRSVSTSSMTSTSSSRKALHPSQTAVNYITQARRLFARLGLAKGQAECAYQLGKLSTRLGPRGELEAAVVLFEEACEKFREAGESVDEAWSMYRLALVMLKVRSSALAIDYLTEARRLFRDAKTDERKAEGSCLLRIGEIYAATGDTEQAKHSIEEGMRLIGNDKSRSRIARRGTICLRRLSAAPSTVAPASATPSGLVSSPRIPPPPVNAVSSHPSPTSPSSPSSPAAEQPSSPARSLNANSIGTGGAGPLAPVLEEEEEEEEDMVEELETPGRRASKAGDEAWWSVETPTATATATAAAEAEGKGQVPPSS